MPLLLLILLISPTMVIDVLLWTTFPSLILTDENSSSPSRPTMILLDRWLRKACTIRCKRSVSRVPQSGQAADLERVRPGAMWRWNASESFWSCETTRSTAMNGCVCLLRLLCECRRFETDGHCAGGEHKARQCDGTYR